MDMSLSKLQEMVKDREAWVLQSMGSQRVRHSLATEQPYNISLKLPTLISIIHFIALLRTPRVKPSQPTYIHLITRVTHVLHPLYET